MKRECNVFRERMGLLNEGNALRRQMQSFAWTDAMLCVGKCKALRGRMQSFAWADAKLCESGCKALRLRWAKLARKFSVLFWIRVNGGKTHLSATVVPRKFLQNSLNVGLSKKVWSLYRAKTPQANSPNPLWGI